jgi:hypothetical protein
MRDVAAPLRCPQYAGGTKGSAVSPPAAAVERALRLRHLLPMPRLSIFDRKPPLSMLTAAQLLDLAREFRDMASTSSTPEVQRSLNVLAARYDGLAAQREIQERGAVRH